MSRSYICATFVLLLSLSVSTPVFAVTANSTFYVGGTAVKTCITGTNFCNTNSMPIPNCPQTGGGTGSPPEVTLYISVPGFGVVPSDCGPDLACSCWYLPVGGAISVYGHMWPVGEITLNRVTQIVP